MKRRDLVIGSAGLAALGLACPAAAQDSYPNRPVTWVIPWPTGGGADFVGRVLAEQMAKALGQPVVVENRPGGSGIIGAQAVTRAAPDGYTLFQGDNGPLVFNSALYEKLPYDPVRDFEPLSLIARYPLVLVAGPGVKANNAREFFNEAKRRPGVLNYASVGVGSAFHLAMELLKQQTGTFIVHVPYRGAGPVIQDVMGGMVEGTVLSTAAAIPLIKAGRLKALGVLTDSRQPQLPNVPTMGEQGISGATVYAWQGMVVPTGTPTAIRKRLHDELVKVLASPETTRRFAEHGVEPLTSTPGEMAAYMRKEAALWHPLIKQRGIKIE